MKKIFIITLLVTACFQSESLLAKKSRSIPYIQNVIWGISGGSLMELGSFKDEINPGFNLVFNSYWPITFLDENLFFVFNSGWDNYTLSNSKNSYLMSVYIEGGMAYRLFINKYFQPFAGLLIHGAYMYVDAEHIEEKGDTYKPGVGIEAGIFSEIFYGFGIKLSVKQKFLPLSDKLYSPFSIEAGATFRYAGFSEALSERGKSRKTSLEEMAYNAAAELDEGNLQKAEKIVARILKKKPEHPAAGSLNRKIESIKLNFEEGKKLYGRKKYLDSLPYLDQTALYYKESAKIVTEIRNRFNNKIPAWERNGVRAYEKQEYDTCITIMRRILLIQPGNSIAKIYLPRAIKRKKALENLQ